MRAAIILAGLTVIVASCASVNTSLPVATLPQTSAPTPVFATELAGPDTYLPPLPTAVIILKPDDMARNRAFCQAALQLPTAQQAEAASVVAPNLIRTRWLVQIGDIPRAHAGDCDFLVGTYDYARAAALTASVRTSRGGFVGRGPYLLMIIPDAGGMHVAGLDGSAVAEADMPGFIAGWGQALGQAERQIATHPRRPGLVRSVFDLVAAILGTVAGGASGLIEGVFAGL